MKTAINLKKFLIFILVLLLTNSYGCMKRVSVCFDSQEWGSNDIIYVTLKSDRKYKLSRAKIEKEYLTGLSGGAEIKIAKSEIHTIEIARYDGKKIVRNIFVVGLVILAYGLISFNYPTED